MAWEWEVMHIYKPQLTTKAPSNNITNMCVQTRSNSYARDDD